MKKIYYYIVILSLTSCMAKHTQYNCQTIKNSELENYPAINLVSEELALNDSSLLSPHKIWVQDSLLIIFDSPVEDNKFFKFYSLNTLQMLHSFGTIGRGPSEYLTPRILWNTEYSFLILEKLKYSILYTDSLLHHPYYQPVKHYIQSGPIAISEAYVLNDSLLFIHSEMSDEQFSINNTLNGNYVIKYTNYPHCISNKLTDFISNSNVYKAIYLLKPNTKDTLAIIYRHFPVIDIIAMNDMSIRRIQFPINNKVNQVKILDKLNAHIENKIEYYTNYYYSEKYFYILYNAISKENTQNYSKSFEIHKFDWQGNLIVRYKSDRYIDKFCVDEKNRKIYAVSIEDNANYSIKILSFNMNN